MRHRHPTMGGISLEEPPHHPHLLARRGAIVNASPCGARPGDGRGHLMEAASSNGGGDGRKKEAAGPKSDATIKSRQRWRRVASIVIGVQRRRWTMACEGVGDVRWRSTETAMVRRGGSETTARIELKQRMADGGCQNWVEAAVVNISAVILHPPSLKMFSTAAALRHRPTVVLFAAVLSSCGGDDNEDDDDRSHQDRTTGMWVLCQGTSTIVTTPMRRRRRQHQQ